MRQRIFYCRDKAFYFIFYMLYLRKVFLIFKTKIWKLNLLKFIYHHCEPEALAFVRQRWSKGVAFIEIAKSNKHGRDNLLVWIFVLPGRRWLRRTSSQGRVVFPHSFILSLLSFIALKQTLGYKFLIKAFFLSRMNHIKLAAWNPEDYFHLPACFSCLPALHGQRMRSNPLYGLRNLPAAATV